MRAGRVIQPDGHYNTDEAAMLLDYSSQTLKDWRHNRQGPKYYKNPHNKRIWYLGQHLLDWQEQSYELVEPKSL